MKEIYPSYYLEIRPEKRKALLPDADLTDEERSFAKYLADCRYTEKNGRIADRFLAQCMELSFLYNNASPVAFFSGRKIRAVLQALQTDIALNGTETQKHLLYLEYFHTALCYLDTCKDAGYRSILGMMTSNESSRTKQIRKDIFEMSEGAAKRFGIENELSLWNKAFAEALLFRPEDPESGT